MLYFYVSIYWCCLIRISTSPWRTCVLRRVIFFRINSTDNTLNRISYTYHTCVASQRIIIIIIICKTEMCSLGCMWNSNSLRVSETWRGRAGCYNRDGRVRIYSKCDACAKSLGSSSNFKAAAKSSESLPHHGTTSCASSNEYGH
jgi:hypothetical protein